MILARHAEALFWAGRQLERAETTTRVLDVVGRNAMHRRGGRVRPEHQALLDLFGVPARLDGDGQVAGIDVAAQLFASPTNPGSVVASVAQLRENVRTVRDRVPVELWEEANRLHLELQLVDAPDRLGDTPFELFSSVRRGCQAMAGVAAEAMPRDEGYTFFDFGRMIERSIGTCRLLRIGCVPDEPVFDAPVVLRMASSLQAYRRHAGYDDDPCAVAGFLLRAEHVPRSVLSCLRRVDSRISLLASMGPGMTPAQQMCGRVRSQLEYDDVAAELDVDAPGYLIRVEAGVVGIGDVIASQAFHPAHTPVMTSQFVRPGVERT